MALNSCRKNIKWYLFKRAKENEKVDFVIIVNNYFCKNILQILMVLILIELNNHLKCFLATFLYYFIIALIICCMQNCYLTFSHANRKGYKIIFHYIYRLLFLINFSYNKGPLVYGMTKVISVMIILL